MEVHLVTPEREIWTGEATMVVAPRNGVGILARHQPMLIRLSPSVLDIKREGGDFRVVVDGGFLHVSTWDGVTRVDVLATGAQLEDEVDVAAAKRDVEEWQRQVEDVDTEEAKLELAKAQARAGLKE
jgi:F-type H+-transporting ATPase subunit epsilon